MFSHTNAWDLPRGTDVFVGNVPLLWCFFTIMDKQLMSIEDKLAAAMEWDDLPREYRKSMYWYAVPKSRDTILDGLDYEIVYVSFNGKFSVHRPGEAEYHTTDEFLWIDKVDSL